VFIASAVTREVKNEHIFMEKQIPRASFVKGKRSDPNQVHEVIIAISKQNLNLLLKILLLYCMPSNGSR